MRAVRDPDQPPEPGFAPAAPPIVPVPVRKRRSRLGTPVLFLALVLLTVAGGAFAWLQYGGRITAGLSGTPDQLPLVKAETTPVKIKPSDPGGLEVPDRDKKIYDRLSGQPASPKVEHLLPPPEEPLPAPRPIALPPKAAEPLPPPVTEALPKVPTEAQVAAAPPPPPLPPTAIPPAPPPSAPPAEVAAAPMPKAPAKPASQPAAPAKAADGAGSGLQLQLAAVRQPDQAERAWAKLKGEHGDLLGDLKLFIVRADLGDKGVFYRVRVGPIADEAAARKRCADLSARKVNCLVVRPGS